MFEFEVHKCSGPARTGEFTTAHGPVQTPVFMPVGTCGSVKGVTPEQVRDCGSQIILGNTYHLMLRPGAETVAELGGLHKLMAWDRPILTDSGGFQVFSLSGLRRIDDESVVFKSHIDGSEFELSPEGAVDIQHKLGSDIMMQLDECPHGKAERQTVRDAVLRSAAWAGRARARWDELDRLTAQNHPQALFGIQQGGVHEDLRAESIQRLVELDLPGYAIGGLSVGEGHEAMCGVLDHTDAQFPPDKPRYLMGVGEPRDILAAVLRGVDMFDCVIPTRNGRNAQVFTWNGKMKLRNACHTADPEPIDPNCSCYTCRKYSRGTLRHLFMAREMLGPTLLTIHNLHFFADFMQAIRRAIDADELADKSAQWLSSLYPPR
ncbi:MAG: tRNA guanosine(34) transglycosylase Tgt [Phycisphaerae bacterium]